MTDSLSLTATLVDQILFAMEDQENFYVLNLVTQQLVTCAGEDFVEDQTLVPIPEWTSADGFRMMREFSESLRHPALQAELKSILDSGGGVFRRFKAALKPFDALFRQWTRFKRHFMEQRVWEWVEDWSDVLSWERSLPGVGIDTDVLTAQEFQVRPGTREDAQALETWDKEALAEAGKVLFSADEALDFADYWRKAGSWKDDDRFWVALGPEKEPVGVLWARPWRSERSGLTSVQVFLWYVRPDYRSLGVGKMLFEHFLDDSRHRGDRRILIQPWVKNENLQPLLSRSGFAFSGSLWISLL